MFLLICLLVRVLACLCRVAPECYVVKPFVIMLMKPVQAVPAFLADKATASPLDPFHA